MRVYSPSQTMTWLRCPVMRQLAYADGYGPRRLGNREAAAILGKAVGAGIASYHSVGGIAGAERLAAQTAKDDIEAYRMRGCVWSEHTEQTASAIADRAVKATFKYSTQCPIPPMWPVEGVEVTLPNHGNARPDLVIRTPTALSVVDWKVKLQLKAEYRAREIERWRHSWQLMHYCWAVGQLWGEPVPRYAIGLIVCEPFSVTLEWFPLDVETLGAWYQSAQRVWAQMEAEDEGRAHPWMAALHSDQYGNCEFYKACFDYRWDENLMGQDYVRRDHAAPV